MEQRGPGHTCGGEQVFTTGYLDYKEKIKKTMDALDFMNDPDALDKMEELKAMDISCDAVIILGERYHDLALEMAEKEADPVRKEELKQIAANLEVVPAHAPQTYWQAIQLYWFTHLAVILNFENGAAGTVTASYNRAEPMGCIQSGTS